MSVRIYGKAGVAFLQVTVNFRAEGFFPIQVTGSPEYPGIVIKGEFMTQRREIQIDTAAAGGKQFGDLHQHLRENLIDALPAVQNGDPFKYFLQSVPITPDGTHLPDGFVVSTAIQSIKNPEEKHEEAEKL